LSDANKSMKTNRSEKIEKFLLLLLLFFMPDSIPFLDGKLFANKQPKLFNFLNFLFMQTHTQMPLKSNRDFLESLGVRAKEISFIAPRPKG